MRAENGFNLIVQAVEGLDGDALLDLSDRFKQRHALPRSCSAASRTGRSP